MGKTFSTGLLTNGLWQDASNNVGIGGSPSGSYKLEVTGTLGVSGLFASTAFGSNSFSAGGTGYNKLTIRNTTAGAANGAQLSIGTNADPDQFYVQSFATNFTTSGMNIAGGAVINGEGPGGLSIAATQSNIQFYTNGAAATNERVRIAATGVSFQVGTNSAGAVDWIARFKNATSTGYGIDIQAATDSQSSALLVRSYTGAFDFFSIRGDGVIFTGNASRSPYNDLNGAAANLIVVAGGNLQRSTASSGRYKENITDWSGNGLETILALKPKTFTYKESYYKYSEVVMLGLIAEEVAEVSPYLADYENQDRTGLVENVRYATIVVPLIAAIKELSAQNQDLKSRLDKAGL